MSTATVLIRYPDGQPGRAITLNRKRPRTTVSVSGGMSATVYDETGRTTVLDDGATLVVLDDETGAVSCEPVDPFAGLDR